jgi:hypothetical protein
MEELDYTRGGVIHEKLEVGGPWGGVILTRDRPRPPLYSDGSGLGSLSVRNHKP